MKLYDYLMNFKKEGVYDIYFRVCFDRKDYNAITKKKMIEEIIMVYQNPYILIDLCSAKELKLIEKLLKLKGKDPKKSEKLLMENQEIFYTLSSKALVDVLFSDSVTLFDELIDVQKEIFNVVDWKAVAFRDRINEFLVGFYKIMGKLLIDVAANLASDVLGIERDVIDDHIDYNMLFNFNVLQINEKVPVINEEKLFGIYFDYNDQLDELTEEKKLQSLTGQMKLDMNIIKNILKHLLT